MKKYLQKESKAHDSSNSFTEELTLNESEAEDLAKRLKSEIKKGINPTPDKELIDLMIAGLADKRGPFRRIFSKTLVNFGKPAIRPLINALHNHSNVTVRRSAAKTLRLIKNPLTLPDLLIALTNDSDPVVQGSSAAAMAVFGEEAIELLIKVIVDPKSNPMQAGLAAWGISFIGEKAPHSIRKAALSENNQIRAAAIAALGDQIFSLKDEEARNILTNALNDYSAEVRAEATILIGNLNEEEWAQSLLINKLEDSSEEVKKNAALALMKLKSNRSITSLKNQLAKEKSPKVLKVLNLAIMKLNESNKELDQSF